MRKIKTFLVLGLFLIIANVGFAQSAIIHIYSSNSIVIYNYYEIEFKKMADPNAEWVSVDGVAAELLYTSYTLDGLECETTYQVRVRPYIEDEFGGREYGEWGYIQITTPMLYEGGAWSWEIGPFDIYAGLFYFRSNPNSMVPIPDTGTIFVSDEKKAIEEK